jgi:hypothetical protein
LELSGTIPALV